MMQNQRKIAAIIVRGLADFKDDKDSGDYSSKSHYDGKEQEVKYRDSEDMDRDTAKMGVESAMEKFIDAIHQKDAKKACEAMLEFQEMSSGVDYYGHDSGDKEKY